MGSAHKTVYANKCVIDTPPMLCSMVADYSACQAAPPTPTPPPTPAPPTQCEDKCDVTGICGSPAGATCAQLVQKYPCDQYYAAGKPYAGWCDKQCGYGACSGPQLATKSTAQSKPK